MSEPSESTLEVAQFDTANATDAAAELLPCCASQRWITEVVNARPFASLEVLITSSDQVLAGLSWPDLLEALAAHPRIGDRATGSDRESNWSREEQATTATAADDVARELREGNVVYEEKFGNVFLICATGLTPEQMLLGLNTRLLNDDETEHEVVREELRKIVRLRLAKVFVPDDGTIRL